VRAGSKVGKRVFDIGIGLFALIALSPLMAIVAALVAINLGRPILFRQRRPGLFGCPFDILKFRTMRDARDGVGELLPDSERITGFGQFLRSTSLDELPEILNVLRGEMSLVGPRPLLMEYLPLYSPRQAQRHEVLPGITGLAQVNGRNAASWRRRLSLDVWYVKNHSVWLDVKILAVTAYRVACREGIQQAGHISSDRFTGKPLLEEGRSESWTSS